MAGEKFENLTPEEKQKIDVWYNSFIQQLADMGISYENPLSLGLIKTVNDYDLETFENLRDSDSMDDNEEAIQMSSSISSMPFMQDDTRPYQGKNFVEHLHQNMRNPEDFSLEEKYRLYTMAKEGKLILESQKLAAGSRVNYQHIMVDPEGKVKITKGAGNFPFMKFNQRLKKDPNALYTEAELAIIQNLGYTEEEFTMVRDQLQDYAQMLLHFEVGMNMFTGSMYEMLKADPNRSQADFRGYFDEMCWTVMETGVLNQAYRNPSWFKTKEDRKKVNDVASVYGLKEVSLSSSEKKLYNNYAMFSTQTIELDRDIRKMLCLKPCEPIPDGAITDHRGKPFTGLNTLEGFNKLAQFCRNDRTELLINGKPYYYATNDMGFQECAPFHEYRDEFEEIYNELKKTDSRFSDDTKSYTDLKDAMKSLSEAWKGNGGKEEGLLFKHISEKLETVASFARAYQDAHRDSELKPRNIQRLTAILKLQRLAESAKNQDMHPREKGEKILEKIAVGAAKEMLSSKIFDFEVLGKATLLDYDAFKRQCRDIQKTDSFHRVLAHKNGRLRSDKQLNDILKLTPEDSFGLYKMVTTELTGKQFNRKTQNFEAPSKAKAVEKNQDPVL